MAVSPQNGADVPKAREEAASSATDRVDPTRNPLLAMLGVGEAALTAFTKALAEANKAMADARARAAEARGKAGGHAEQVQHRLADLPQRMSGEELRRLLDELRVQVEKFYAEFAERGEHTWEHWRSQPQFQQAVATLKAYSEKLDAHVDTFVDEARDAGEKALSTVSRQTRSAGERVARSTQRFSAGAARTTTVASQEASRVVADTGAEVAGAIAEAGDEVANETRSTTRKAADRTAPAKAPRTAADRAAARKPANRRTSPTEDPSTDS
jgi:heparin binding hemagglutinin HbhA